MGSEMCIRDRASASLSSAAPVTATVPVCVGSIFHATATLCPCVFSLFAGVVPRTLNSVVQYLCHCHIVCLCAFQPVRWCRASDVVDRTRRFNIPRCLRRCTVAAKDSVATVTRNTLRRNCRRTSVHSGYSYPDPRHIAHQPYRVIYPTQVSPLTSGFHVVVHNNKNSCLMAFFPGQPRKAGTRRKTRSGLL